MNSFKLVVVVDRFNRFTPVQIKRIENDRELPYLNVMMPISIDRERIEEETKNAKVIAEVMNTLSALGDPIEVLNNLLKNH